MVLPGMALGFAVITVISRCIGAGDYEQARYFTKKLLKITYLSMLVTNILVVVAMPVIVKLYNLPKLPVPLQCRSSYRTALRLF